MSASPLAGAAAFVEEWAVVWAVEEWAVAVAWEAAVEWAVAVAWEAAVEWEAAEWAAVWEAAGPLEPTSAGPLELLVQ